MNTNMSKDRIERFLEEYGTDGKFFLLTRDHPITITIVGGGVDGWEKGSLFHYGNQVLNINDRSDEPDDFGRNLIDRSFIALCLTLYIYAPYVQFKSLTTRKDGDRYMVRVRYDDVDLEMEVVEMFHYFTEKLKEGK